MSSNYRNLLVNLGVIAKLEKMDKLNTMYQIFYREKPSFFTSLSRWYRDDNQDKTMLAVEELINQALLALENENYSSRESVKLFKYVYGCVDGLSNLRMTYKDKDSTYEHITILIETIKELPQTFPSIHQRYLEMYSNPMNSGPYEDLSCESSSSPSMHHPSP